MVEAEGPGAPGAHGTLVIRPERVRLVPLESHHSVVATIERTVYLGAMSDVVVTMPTGESLSARVASEDAGGFRRGEQVGVLLRPEAMRLVPAGALLVNSEEGTTARLREHAADAAALERTQNDDSLDLR